MKQGGSEVLVLGFSLVSLALSFSKCWVSLQDGGRTATVAPALPFRSDNIQKQYKCLLCLKNKKILSQLQLSMTNQQRCCHTAPNWWLTRSPFCSLQGFLLQRKGWPDITTASALVLQSDSLLSQNQPLYSPCDTLCFESCCCSSFLIYLGTWAGSHTYQNKTQHNMSILDLQ